MARRRRTKAGHRRARPGPGGLRAARPGRDPAAPAGTPRALGRPAGRAGDRRADRGHRGFRDSRGALPGSPTIAARRTGPGPRPVVQRLDPGPGGHSRRARRPARTADARRLAADPGPGAGRDAPRPVAAPADQRDAVQALLLRWSPAAPPGEGGGRSVSCCSAPTSPGAVSTDARDALRTRQGGPVAFAGLPTNGTSRYHPPPRDPHRARGTGRNTPVRHGTPPIARSTR